MAMEHRPYTPLDFALLNHDDDLYGASLELFAQQQIQAADGADHPLPMHSVPVSTLASARVGGQEHA